MSEQRVASAAVRRGSKVARIPLPSGIIQFSANEGEVQAVCHVPAPSSPAAKRGKATIVGGGRGSRKRERQEPSPPSSPPSSRDRLFDVQLPDGSVKTVKADQPKKAAHKALSAFLYKEADALRSAMEERWREVASHPLPSLSEALRDVRDAELRARLVAAREDSKFSSIPEEKFVTYVLRASLLRKSDFREHRITIRPRDERGFVSLDTKEKRYVGGYSPITCMSPWKVERGILYDCKIHLDKKK